MAKIDYVLDEVRDEELRERLRIEVGHLRSQTAFGLVFEGHPAEILPLTGMKIRRGTIVARRDGDSGATLTVLSVRDGTARCTDGDGEIHELVIDDLVAVQKPGQRLYPALKHVESVNAGGDAPYHVVIEGENHSALRLLGWTHARQVDCIYIDPPYNTGATSWMYNNKIVDGNDAYRSSKWLAMMERRLKLAKPLLKQDGVLIITIDENEVATLRLLLERPGLFGGWDIHIVAIEHNPRGIQGQNFSVTNEYALFVVPPNKQLIASRRLPPNEQLSQPLRKWGAVSTRDTARNCFYPIRFRNGAFLEAGPVLPNDEHPAAAVRDLGDGVVEFWPIDHNGVERKWRYARNRVDDIAANFRIKRGRHGEQVHLVNDSAAVKTVWRNPRYAAFSHGTKLVNDISGGRFPFPKSIYATLDCVDLVVRDRPEAVVLDFFGGSGTTLHAVAMLNAADGGQRRCITVTNNEIAAVDQRRLRDAGLRPGDDLWEADGICRSITFPRLRNAILGHKPDGTRLAGEWATGRHVQEPRGIALQPLDAFSGLPLTKSTTSQIATLAGLPTSVGPFHVPDFGNGDVALLLDPASAGDFIETIIDAADEHGTHIRRVLFIPPSERAAAKELRARLEDGLPLYAPSAEETRPYADGLAANLAYLRLQQLDPNSLEAGRGLDDLLPTLWLMAGARGPVTTGTDQPSYLIPPQGRFGLLIDQSACKAFAKELRSHGNIDWLYVVADTVDAFDDVIRQIPISLRDGNAKRLYSSYLDNFTIETSD